MAKACVVKGCPNRADRNNPECRTHRYRRKRGLPLDNKPLVKPSTVTWYGRGEAYGTLYWMVRRCLEVR